MNSLNFSDGECLSTHTFGDTHAGTDGEFQEVILYESTSRAVIWTAILDNNVTGFDQKGHDFQLMVPEDGHGTDTDGTTYYFYVELE